MKKRVVGCFFVLGLGNFFALQPLGKKLATTAAVLSGAITSCVFIHKKVNNSWRRSLGIAGISGVTGAALMGMWKTQQPLPNKTSSEKDSEGKFLDLYTLCQETECQEDYELRVKKIQHLEKALMSASKDKDFYAILQYDQQKLRRVTQPMSLIVVKNGYTYDTDCDFLKRETKTCKKVKDIVEFWYKQCQLEAIIEQVRRELVIYDVSSVYLELEKFFKNTASRFCEVLEKEEHEKICKDMRRERHWKWLNNEGIRKLIFK